MRIDKFLWCVRLYKTRSLATKACEHNQVKIQGNSVKASREVKIGETIQVDKEGIKYLFGVKAIPESRMGAPLVVQFLENQTPQEELDKKNMMRLNYTPYREKGSGRPTKKERRDLDDWTTI
jgi:ribosome-associated heat shock protein Hsp15